MTTEEKFNAAVNVIKSLPKNGSYQPSNELMLRFYAYYKQATLGPCTGKRPAFWDLVGRAKYDAHNELGNMTKQEAMANYVDELHRIVETMSYSQNVANFLEAPSDELNSINMSDLELIVGDVMERVRSESNSPISSRDASPNRLHSASPVSSVDPPSSADSDYSDDEYIDSFDVPQQSRKTLANGNPNSVSICNGFIPSKENRSRPMTKTTLCSSDIDISREISQTVNSLKVDIEHLTCKVNALERGDYSVRRKNMIFSNFTPQMFVFLVVWPFLASFIINKLLHRK